MGPVNEMNFENAGSGILNQGSNLIEDGEQSEDPLNDSIADQDGFIKLDEDSFEEELQGLKREKSEPAITAQSQANFNRNFSRSHTEINHKLSQSTNDRFKVTPLISHEE